MQYVVTRPLSCQVVEGDRNKSRGYSGSRDGKNRGDRSEGVKHCWRHLRLPLPLQPLGLAPRPDLQGRGRVPQVRDAGPLQGAELIVGADQVRHAALPAGDHPDDHLAETRQSALSHLPAGQHRAQHAHHSQVMLGPSLL